MKITNKTIGLLIGFVLIAALHWFATFGSVYTEGFCFECEPPPLVLSLGSELSRFFSVAFWILMAILLSSGAIEFRFNIPIPFANLLKSIEAKRGLNKAISEKYTAMAKLEGYEFDRAHKEVKVLEKQLEKLEA